MEQPSVEQAGRGPAKQARGRRTRARLLTAGLTLLQQRDFDQIGIAELAAEAQSSIGAFYHHFADKEGFYDALMAVAVSAESERARAGLAAGADPGSSTPALLRQAVALLRAATRDNQGLIRAALKKSMTDPEAWAPVRGFARGFDAELVAHLEPRAGDFGCADWRERLAIGQQMVYGTLFNAIVNRPGPLQIEDERIVDELTQMLLRQLEVSPRH